LTGLDDPFKAASELSPYDRSGAVLELKTPPPSSRRISIPDNVFDVPLHDGLASFAQRKMLAWSRMVPHGPLAHRNYRDTCQVVTLWRRPNH